MIDLYYWATPNGHKITIYLEEIGLAYAIRPVNLSEGEQLDRSFLRISPNNRIPAIVDYDPADGGEPLSVFESGAILEYLAEKTGKLLPVDPRARVEVMQWLFWQTSGMGPMLGQNLHFSRSAPEIIPYALERYRNETKRLYAVLDRRLEQREFIAGAYSIADVATYPWVVPHAIQGIRLGAYPNVKRWFDAVAARAPVKRAYARAAFIETPASRAGRPPVPPPTRAVGYARARH